VLYLIGGVGRTGKSTLAKMLVAEIPMLWTSTDLIQWTLSINAPQLGVRTGLDGVTQEKAFRPFLQSLCLGQIDHEEHSVIEGHVVHPEFAMSLRDEGHEVRSCFLGWSAIDRDEFLAHQGRNTWLLRRDEATRTELINAIVPESTELKRRCDAVGLPFIDMAAGPYDKQVGVALAELLDAN
jgi:hypothetical protein